MGQAHKRAVDFSNNFNTCTCAVCEGFRSLSEEQYMKEIFDIIVMINKTCDEAAVPVATRAEAMAFHIGNCIYSVLQPKNIEEMGKFLDMFYNDFIRPSVLERFEHMQKAVGDADKMPNGLEEFVKAYLKARNKGLKPEDGPVLGMLDIGFDKDGKFTVLGDEKFDVPDKIKFGDEEINPKEPDDPETK